MTAAQLQSRLDAIMPGFVVRQAASGNLHVGKGGYSLTITRPDEPISAENIVANAGRA